jgi:hypothetical protein
LLIDSLGPWVGAHDGFITDTDALVDALRGHRGDVIVVSE